MPKIKHGMTHTPIHNVWKNIKKCKHKNLVCEEWMEFLNFYHDVGDRPNNKVAHRIDTNLPWSKDNFEWITKRKLYLQRSCFLTYEDETLSERQWARELDMSYKTLKYRINKGWDIEDAFYIPAEMGNNAYNIQRTPSKL